MSETLEKIATPSWMLELFKSIDELDTSEKSGFACFTDDVEMQFGPHKVQGMEAMKKFFIEIDALLVTVHRVGAVYRVGDAIFMHGSADIRKKSEPKEKNIEVSPLLNLFWLNPEGKVEAYIVTFPPSVGRAAGVK